MPKLFDLEAIRAYLQEVVWHFEQSAPHVSQWADDLYIRTVDDWRSITLDELRTAEWLRNEEWWNEPHLAQNTVYHLLDRLGRDTTGFSDF